MEADWSVSDSETFRQAALAVARKQCEEAIEDAKMSQYDRFVVQLEVPDGIREGYRSFIAACDGAYYDGSSYSAAKAMYDKLAVYEDGIHGAVILTAHSIEYDDWDVLETNEINDVYQQDEQE